MITYVVDLYQPQLLEIDLPLHCIINQKTIILARRTWKDLLIGIVEHFIIERNPYLDLLDDFPINGSDIFFLNDSTNLDLPWKLSNGRWIELNYTPDEIINIIRNLCVHCRLDLDKVKIYYSQSQPRTGINNRILTEHKDEYPISNIVKKIIRDEHGRFVAKKKVSSLQKRSVNKPKKRQVKSSHNKTNRNSLGQYISRKKTITSPKNTKNQEKHSQTLNPPNKPFRDEHGRFVSQKKVLCSLKKVPSVSPTTPFQSNNQKFVKTEANPIYRKRTTNRPLDLNEIDNISSCALTEKSTEHIPNAYVDPMLIDVTKYTLMTHFPRGFKIDSVIELTRFRKFIKQEFDSDSEISDDDLKAIISSCGMMFDGKIFHMNTSVTEQIQREINSVFNSGAQIIFYESFYEHHADWLYQTNIVSPSMLKTIIERLYPNMLIKKNYFGLESGGIPELERIEKEILRVWGSDRVKTYTELTQELPYIPEEKIKICLHANSDFICNRNKQYTHLSRFSITTSELDEIRSKVNQRMATCEFIPLADICLPSSLELRYSDLDPTTIKKIIVKAFLIDDFDIKGKILAKKDNSINVKTIMVDFCNNMDKCSLNDITTKEKELTGKKNGWYSLEAAYSVLVRIDKNTFVSEKYVDFDIDAIDYAISLFVQDEHLPLKAFTTFAEFPDCKQMWNLYLLESYCRRFSKMFKFETPSVNSRNAGIVIRANCNLSYLEIMTKAVKNSGIPWENKAIIEYLYQNGYIGKKTTSKSAEIVKKLKSFDERMV